MTTVNQSPEFELDGSQTARHTEGDYFLVTQGKTGQKLRILMRTEAGENSLGRLVREISERNVGHSSKYLLINRHGKRMTKGMLRLRWDKAREKSQAERHRTRRPAARCQDWRVSVPRHPAEGRVGNHRYRGCQPAAGTQQTGDHKAGLQEDWRHRETLQIGRVSELLPESFGTPAKSRRNLLKPQKHKSPA
ncbi:hypothetical protein JTY93_15255 [Pseudomonas hygromyciniae]|uniref:Integrase n=1 Tax=Pseudomonas hygromyciniae TaxID=2812000 RepID=A0ABX7JQP7_9PSED|nr:hypothetical protein [Pseudomonas hygromyciniae]QSB37697.1 hypothetical protein JTY93_15255 [Pseudomonas hygromyciniae]